MTPKNMPPPPAPKAPCSALRPADFLLPQADKSAARKRNGEPDVYVSWGGQIYGPTAAEDVIKGVRTSYFEEDALFWFESRDAWRPVSELPALFEDPAEDLPTAARLYPAPPQGAKPSRPGARERSSSAGGKRRRSRRNRASRAARARIVGPLIVIAAVLLAVILTAGLLLLMSLV